MHTRRIPLRTARYLVLALATSACGGGDDAAADAGADLGSGAVAAGEPSDGPVYPPCDVHGAYVRLELAGPGGGPFAWEAADFTECHGGGVYDEASLQFDLKGPAGEGVFHVKLTTQPSVAVASGLPAEAHLSLEAPDVILDWRMGCTAEITDVRPIPNPQGGAWSTGLWDRYTGTVHCDSVAKPLFSQDEYTLPSAAFQGISHRPPQ